MEKRMRYAAILLFCLTSIANVLMMGRVNFFIGMGVTVLGGLLTLTAALLGDKKGITLTIIGLPVFLLLGYIVFGALFAFRS